MRIFYFRAINNQLQLEAAGKNYLQLGLMNVLQCLDLQSNEQKFIAKNGHLGGASECRF